MPSPRAQARVRRRGTLFIPDRIARIMKRKAVVLHLRAISGDRNKRVNEALNYWHWGCQNRGGEFSTGGVCKEMTYVPVVPRISATRRRTGQQPDWFPPGFD